VVRRLDKRYGHVQALTGVSLSVAAGTVVGLVGPNGAGKSTLLGIVAGVVAPDAGEVLVCGARAGTLSAARAVAYVPDEPTGLDELTVRELLSLLAVLHGSRPGVARRRQELVDRFTLGVLRDRRLAELSRGQRRRVSLVAAFQLGMPLVLVDEATAALDVDAADALRVTLREAADRGAGALVAAHDPAFVRDTADAVVEVPGAPARPLRERRAGEPVPV
jgi:ABC-type multidrug transport system ATPase subunit